MTKKPEYTFGECKMCKKIATLKNGYCIQCNEKLKKITGHESISGNFFDFFDMLFQ